MSPKIAILLFACCSLAMGYSIAPRDKRETVDQMQSNIDATTSNDTNNADSDSDSNTESNMSNPLKGLGNRMKDAFGKTYQEEKNSVSDSWNNMKDLMTQRIQTGANLTKTAFDLGTIVPKFGKNFILSNDSK